MSTSAPNPLQLELHADSHITRWRPLVQWLLAIPHLLIAWALRTLRQVLTLISFFTVLFTTQIPRPLFDAIVMTYRYEWRAMSYAFFMHEDYPPFDFDLSSEDDGVEPHTSLRLTYPEQLERWNRCINGSSPFPSTWSWPFCAWRRAWPSSLASSPWSSPGSTRKESGASSSTPTATRSASRPTSDSSPISTRRSASSLERTSIHLLNQGAHSCPP